MLSSIALSPSLMAQGDPKQKKKLAIITTEWRFRSHAWHMGERFLGGYPVKGKWHRPAIEVVSAYVDQVPAGDLSKARALESNFKIYPTIAEALRCGTDKLAVDAVLIIGEHGTYPDNELGQKKYPRYEFFQKVVEVFKKDGMTTPIFNDKHLSWNWEWAKEMVDTSRKMKFPLLAGSSLPVTWRMPAVEMPSMNKATVSFVSRPNRCCTIINATVPRGRAMNAKEKMMNEYSVPVSGSSKGKNIFGNTRTDAIAYTKKSKYSEARPITTPIAISPGVTLLLLP